MEGKTTSVAALSASAANAAKKALIDQHKEEFTKLLGDEREARGLPRTSEADPRVKLQAKLEKLKAQEAQVERELEALNNQ